MVGLLHHGGRPRPVPLDENLGRSNARTDRSRDAQNYLLLGLICLTFGVMVLVVTYEEWVPLAALGIPVLIGGLLLTLRPLLVLVTVAAMSVAATLGVLGTELLRLAEAAIVGVFAVIVLVAAARARSGHTGESMLIDLRDRLRFQSELPELPRGWSAQSVMRSAGGAQFAGDFVVAAKTRNGDALEIVVVDVSGKGLAAGTRALLLSGAFGGLLCALPPEQFLPAANEYLLRQAWSEGFATAAHVSVNLLTGEFELRTAGHPPGVQLHSGSGRWQVHGSSGPALGLLDDAEFLPTTGRLQHGDALMLFTDGLVETAERDFTLGIDKLVGEAERMGREGFNNGAQRLLDRLDASADDRALVFVHRR